MQLLPPPVYHSQQSQLALDLLISQVCRSLMLMSHHYTRNNIEYTKPETLFNLYLTSNIVKIQMLQPRRYSERFQAKLQSTSKMLEFSLIYQFKVKWLIKLVVHSSIKSKKSTHHLTFKKLNQSTLLLSKAWILLKLKPSWTMLVSLRITFRLCLPSPMPLAI